MNPVTIITGPPASGKTTLALKMAEGKKALWLSNFEFEKKFWQNWLDEDTELIIIEEAVRKESIKILITTETLSVQKRGKPLFEMKRPEVIITSNFLSESYLSPRTHLKFINL